MTHNDLQKLEIPLELQNEIESIQVKRKVKKKTLIFSAGGDPDGIYLLKKGLIGLTYNSEEGGEHLLRIFKPGQFFGHRSLFAGDQYHANAICMEDSEIFFIERKKLFELLERNPKLSLQFLKNLAMELKHCETHRVMLTEKDVIERAAESIVYLMEISENHKWTRNDIAKYCESTSTTIVKALAVLEEQNLIKQEGHKIIILNREGLLSFKQS